MRCFGIGVVLGAWVWPHLQPPVAHCAAAALATVFCSVLPVLRPTLRAILFILCGVFLGAGWVARIPAGPELSGDVSVRGVVATASQGRSADVEVVAAGARGVVQHPTKGRIRVAFPGVPPPAGAVVMVQGTARPIDPTRLPGDVDPAVEAARAGIRSTLRAKDVIRLGEIRELPDFDGVPHAGLLRALVMGDASEIPEEERELLRRTGTWHLVSVSGLHVGLGAAIAWGLVWVVTRPLSWWIPRPYLRWVCAVAGAAGGCFYADLADWGVPARRAAWMAAAGCAVAASSRRPELGRILALAAVGTVWAEPASVGSLGFQLSFGAMGGTLFVSPYLQRFRPPDLPRLTGLVYDGLVLSLGSTAGTFPVVALHFQSLSALSPVANLWAVPWIGTVATPLAVAAWALPGWAGNVALAVASAAAEVGVSGVRFFDISPSAPAVGAVGAVGLGLAAIVVRRPLLAIVSVIALLCGRTGRPGELVVTFLAVGQGDATLVEWPDGRRWLVDGGPPGDALLHALRRRHIDRLDAVFLSHAHPDHYGGLLPVLQHLRVEQLITNGLVAGMNLSGVREWSSAHGALLPMPNDWEDENENNRSLILRFGLGEHSFLLSGDAERAQETALVATQCSALSATVLKLGHHGSRTSSTAPFLACVQPQIAVATVGIDNRYGHPHFSTLRTLQNATFSPAIWRTDRDGSVEVRTDGHSLQVRGVATPRAWLLRDSLLP